MSDNNPEIIKDSNNYNEISIDDHSDSENGSARNNEDSADYEIDEKNDVIIDKRIKYFLI